MRWRVYCEVGGGVFCEYIVRWGVYCEVGGIL